MKKKESALAFLYHDHLSLEVSSLKALENFEQKDVLMVECPNEATVVPHHKQKLVLWFASMRKFSEKLKKKGYTVHYIKIDSKLNEGNIKKTVKKFLEKKSYGKCFVTHPGEHRQLEDIKAIHDFEVLNDDRFISDSFDFRHYADTRKTLVMEYFYREMRRATKVLMTKDSKPEAGAWNFDKDNRKTFVKEKPKFKLKTTRPCKVTEEVMHLVEKNFSQKLWKTR